MDFDDILSEVLDKLIEDKKVDIEEYCQKYPQYKDELLSKFRTAEFLRKNFREEDFSGKKLGEYLILQELGRGGMGVVYLAIHPALSRLTAIKILPPVFMHDKDLLNNFQEEAKNIAQFNHPNIVPIYSINKEKGLLYIAMGYIPGPSIKNIIEMLKDTNIARDKKITAIRRFIEEPTLTKKDISQKSISLKRSLQFWDRSYFQFVATLGSEISSAVNYGHQNGIIHGDLKPSNILLTHEAIPMIVDFGLSKNIKKTTALNLNEFTGTLAYAAPEQINEHIVSEKTDIWSLGITLYELLTLKNPYKSDIVQETVQRILENRPLPLIMSDRNIPHELRAIISKCLETNPEKRYKSMEELSTDLNSYLELRPIKAKKLSIGYRAYLRIKRHPIISLLTFSLISIIMITSVLFLNKKISDYIHNGDSYYQQGKYNDALLNYNKALNLTKIIPFVKFYQKEIFSGIGDALYGKGTYQEAISYYKKALVIDPKYISAIAGLGSTYYEIGSYDEAIKNDKLAINLVKNDRDNYYMLGQALMKEGLFDDAIKNFQIAIKLSPNDTDTRDEIISTLNKKGLSGKDEIINYLEKNGFGKEQIDSLISYLNKLGHPK